MEPVIIKRVFPCAKRRLFEAWSQPAVMADWFFSSQEPRQKSTVSNTFTVGGQYSLTMHLQTGDFTMRGEYREIVRYNRIVFTWNSHIVENTQVELEFKELSPNRTEMTLTHSQFPDEDVRGRHVEGWGRCLANLERYIAEPAQS
jgi:uncharacterized protein YndB with AHSA1/START domain